MVTLAKGYSEQGLYPRIVGGTKPLDSAGASSCEVPTDFPAVVRSAIPANIEADMGPTSVATDPPPKVAAVVAKYGSFTGRKPPMPPVDFDPRYTTDEFVEQWVNQQLELLPEQRAVVVSLTNCERFFEYPILEPLVSSLRTLNLENSVVKVISFYSPLWWIGSVRRAAVELEIEGREQSSSDFVLKVVHRSDDLLSVSIEFLDWDGALSYLSGKFRGEVKPGTKVVSYQLPNGKIIDSRTSLPGHFYPSSIPDRLENLAEATRQWFKATGLPCDAVSSPPPAVTAPSSRMLELDAVPKWCKLGLTKEELAFETNNAEPVYAKKKPMNNYIVQLFPHSSTNEDVNQWVEEQLTLPIEKRASCVLFDGCSKITDATILEPLVFSIKKLRLTGSGVRDISSGSPLWWIENLSMGWDFFKSTSDSYYKEPVVAPGRGPSFKIRFSSWKSALAYLSGHGGKQMDCFIDVYGYQLPNGRIIGLNLCCNKEFYPRKLSDRLELL